MCLILTMSRFDYLVDYPMYELSLRDLEILLSTQFGKVRQMREKEVPVRYIPRLIKNRGRFTHIPMKLSFTKNTLLPQPVHAMTKRVTYIDSPIGDHMQWEGSLGRDRDLQVMSH